MNDEHGAIDDAVPAAFTTTVPKPPRPLGPTEPLHRLFGARVTVWVSGTRVTGVLVGADEDDLYVRTETRSMAYPLASVEQVHRLPDVPTRPRPLPVPPGFERDP